MSRLNITSITPSVTDPTIQNYTISYTPSQFNNTVFPTSDQILSYSFNDLYNTQVAGLNSQTISQVLNNPAYHDVKINSINTTLNGVHGFNCSDGTLVDLNLYDQNGNLSAAYNFTDQPPRYYSGNTVINLNETLPNPPILDRYTVKFFVATVNPGCGYRDFVNIVLTYTISLQVGFCNAQSIGNSQCISYCRNNPRNCTNDYISYCFSGEPSNMPIGANTPEGNACRNFVQNNGPTSEFDQGIALYCKSKYKGFGDLFNRTDNQTDQDLCACHMPPEQYASFEQEISANYVGFGNLGFVDQCLVPNCASSPFKTTTIGQACKLPACLNITTFTNSGTFDNSTVTINQSTAGCANIKPVNSGGGGNNWTWLWIMIAVIVAIVIFLIIIALAVKHKNYKRQNPVVSIK